MVSASKDSGIEYLREHVREDTRMYYTFLEAGKSREAHEAVVYGAKILAGTCMELLEKPELLEEIREEFRMAKKHSGAV